jgi:hypothetical protein
MGFAGAGAADEDAVALGVEEDAGGEFAQLALVDRRLGEDERVEVFEDRELGPADAIADRAGLTMCAFRPDQAGDGGSSRRLCVKTTAADHGARLAELRHDRDRDPMQRLRKTCPCAAAS